MKVTPFDIKPSDYNPREFSEENKEALNTSMNEFGDISGITFNKETGNLVTGHHRWDNICELYGIDSLVFKTIKGTGSFKIFTDSMYTSYNLRVVEWSLEKEKLANITANSPTVQGRFTDGLQGILDSVSNKLSKPFKKLQLDELSLNIKRPNIKPKRARNIPKKSETMINAGGDTYRTVKLELSPELADRLHDTLDKFKSSKSVEEPLKLILDYIDMFKKEDIIKSVNKPRRKRR